MFPNRSLKMSLKIDKVLRWKSCIIQIIYKLNRKSYIKNVQTFHLSERWWRLVAVVHLLMTLYSLGNQQGILDRH